MIETDKLNQFIVQIKAKYLLPEKGKIIFAFSMNSLFWLQKLHIIRCMYNTY